MRYRPWVSDHGLSGEHRRHIMMYSRLMRLLLWSVLFGGVVARRRGRA
jgi:hypothetical protein